MSEAARDQGWLPPTEPREESERERLLRLSPRYCSFCVKWGDHHDDEHPRDDDGPILDKVEGKEAVKEARRALREANR